MPRQTIWQVLESQNRIEKVVTATYLNTTFKSKKIQKQILLPKGISKKDVNKYKRNRLKFWKEFKPKKYQEFAEKRRKYSQEYRNKMTTSEKQKRQKQIYKNYKEKMMKDPEFWMKERERQRNWERQKYWKKKIINYLPKYLFIFLKL